MKLETPWHLRQPRPEHEHWFKNLVDLHETTLHWIQDLKETAPSYSLTRGFDDTVIKHLWILESLGSSQLGQFLDGHQPEELLMELEKAVWTFHSWTVSRILAKNINPNITSLKNLLEQSSWKSGRQMGEARWAKTKNLGRFDLASIYFALQDSPLAHYPRSRTHLIRRATVNQVELELKSCPHQIGFPEIKENSDLLCQLHAQWCRGFVYSLNPRVTIEHETHPLRCTQKWILN